MRAARRRSAQRGEAEAQQIAALVARQRVQLVDHDPAQAAKILSASTSKIISARGTPAWSAASAAGSCAGADVEQACSRCGSPP